MIKIRIDANPRINYVPSMFKVKSNYNNMDVEKNTKDVDSQNKRSMISNVNVEEPYKIVYNKATLNKANNNSTKELSDDEINDRVNYVIYKQSYLEKSGMEFNSVEFKKWLQDNKDKFPVPLDAPAKVRECVYEILGSAKDMGIRYFLLKDFTRGFNKVKDHSDLNSYMKVTDNILKGKKDYLKLLKIHDSDDPIIKKAIADFTEIVNEIFTFKNKLKDIILDDKAKRK